MLFLWGIHGHTCEALICGRADDSESRAINVINSVLLTSVTDYYRNTISFIFILMFSYLSHAFFPGKPNGTRRTDGRKISEGKRKRKRSDWRKNECRKRSKKS